MGVEYVNDTVLRPDADQTVHTARASRLVVVSAGAFGSPTILERWTFLSSCLANDVYFSIPRSGIGGLDILRAHGVQPLVDLPGVGQNYQDHNGLFPPYFASEEAETLDAFLRGEEVEEQRESAAISLLRGLYLLCPKVLLRNGSPTDQACSLTSE